MANISELCEQMPQTFKNIIQNRIKNISFGGYVLIAFLCFLACMTEAKENPQFKYQKHMSEEGLDGKCPPKGCVENEIPTYRWVFDDMEHPHNFTPRSLMPVPRVNSKDDLKKCSGFGLSMYDTLKNAITAFESFPKNTRIKLGYKNVASGKVIKSDGVTTEISESGHFDLHEYEKVDLKIKFKIVSSLWKS
jgi:hypothetical protein